MSFDLKKFVQEPISKEAKKMTDLQNYLKFEERKFEVISQSHEKILLEQQKKQALIDKLINSKNSKKDKNANSGTQLKQQQNLGSSDDVNGNKINSNQSHKNANLKPPDSQAQLNTSSRELHNGKNSSKRQMNQSQIYSPSSNLLSPQNKEEDDPYRDELLELLGKTKNERGFDYHKFRVLYKTKYIKIEIQREMQINKEKEDKKRKDQQRLDKLKQKEDKAKKQKVSILVRKNSDDDEEEDEEQNTEVNTKAPQLPTPKEEQATPKPIIIPKKESSINSPQVQSQPISHRLFSEQKAVKKSYMFQSTSRDYIWKLQNQGKCSPPLGKYFPKYDLLYESQKICKIRPTKDADIFNMPSNDNNREPDFNCTKLTKQIKEIEDQLQNQIKASQQNRRSVRQSQDQQNNQNNNNSQDNNQLASFDHSQNNNSVNLPQTPPENNNYQTQLIQSFDLSNPVMKKQQKLEQLWGYKVRQLSPIKDHHLMKDSKQQYQGSQMSIMTCQRDIPDFSKQSKRENYVHKTSLKPHDQRFEMIDKFPNILSKNTKLAAGIDLKRQAKRRDFILASGIGKDKLVNQTPIDVNYNQVHKRVTGLQFGKSTKFRSFSQMQSNDSQPDEEEMIQPFQHEDFKPKIKFKRHVNHGQATHFFILDD
ncbi:UNKNOWN [Stylonychia lemnae]|uniref:Uncharacterized protein n=1 Tax=Stylonychia lemnae TaxID=5949 RepID=A0A078AGW4_STYLE|nr:UNKNOWN [Stylonychia lemnae]|eukprot:CDW80767.1 UNKNOWN [Stylonychia lemnae]